MQLKLTDVMSSQGSMCKLMDNTWQFIVTYNYDLYLYVKHELNVCATVTMNIRSPIMDQIYDALYDIE